MTLPIEDTYVVPIERCKLAAYKIPTTEPESDGTFEWEHTTLVLVELSANGQTGIGYTYADPVTAAFIDRTLAPLLAGKNCMDIPRVVGDLTIAIRNQGTCGISMMAVACIDNALWDLKAKLLNLPLSLLLGCYRQSIPIYASGGFTSLSDKALRKEIKSWSDQGFSAVKIKIGREPYTDGQRIEDAGKAKDESVELYVDANGAYTVRQALQLNPLLLEAGATWFEEPVSSDNLSGLRFIRDHVSAPINISAGEYGYHITYFREMLQQGAVDVLQADATRCGLSGYLHAGHLCEAFQIPFSSHCAPALHLQASMSLPAFKIGEYFEDHVRIEQMLFEGFPIVKNGQMKPANHEPGYGLQFRHADAAKFKI